MKIGLMSLVLAGFVATQAGSSFAASMQLAQVVQSVNMSTSTALQQAIVAAVSRHKLAGIEVNDEVQLAISRELKDLTVLKVRGKELTSLHISILAELFAPCAVLMAQYSIDKSFDFSGIVVQYLETVDTKDETIVALAWNKAAEAVDNLKKAMAALKKGVSPEDARKVLVSTLRGVFTADEREQCKGDSTCLKSAPAKGSERAALFSKACS